MRGAACAAVVGEGIALGRAFPYGSRIAILRSRIIILLPGLAPYATAMKTLPRYSFGVGDRFAHEAEAQLAAFERLAAAGVVVAPVWNKSNREHSFIGSEPASVREAAAAAVAKRKWPHPWFVDADHIRLDTVDRFLASSDFFTIDVADSIGKPAGVGDVAAFVARHPELAAPVTIPGIAQPIGLSAESLAAIAQKYLLACREAGEIQRHIVAKRGADGSSASPGEVAMVLAGTYQALVVSDAAAGPSARSHRFHTAMARRDARPDTLNATSAMTSVRLGTGYPARAAETMVAARIGNTGEVPDPAAFAAEMLPPGPECDKLAQVIATVLHDRLAVWRGLGIV